MINELKNKIHLGDCLDFMRKLPDKCIDLVLTDPPYGIGESKGKNKSRGYLATAKDYGYKEWDAEIPRKEYFDEMRRISKNQIIFGGNYFVEYLSNSPCWIVWNKLNGATDFADCELAWTSFKSAVRLFDYRWQGMLQGNMKNKEERLHPTQKPLPLFIWLLEKFGKPGQTVFDPFSGSGTTAIACHNLGLDFICVEKDPDYHAASVARLEKHRQQMFLPFDLHESTEHERQADLFCM